MEMAHNPHLTHPAPLHRPGLGSGEEDSAYGCRSAAQTSEVCDNTHSFWAVDTTEWTADSVENGCYHFIAHTEQKDRSLWDRWETPQLRTVTGHSQVPALCRFGPQRAATGTCLSPDRDAEHLSGLCRCSPRPQLHGPCADQLQSHPSTGVTRAPPIKKGPTASECPSALARQGRGGRM